MLLSFADFILLPFYLAIIYLIGQSIMSKNINRNPSYKYFLSGLFVKILGGIALALIYTLYYKGGDTIGYYESALVLEKLRKINFWRYLEIMSSDKNLTLQTYSYFTSATGWPLYFFDPQAFAIVRITSIVNLFCFDSYLITSVIFSAISFSGVWRLFLLFTELYRENTKQLAISILFVPSVLFWGSGVLKDNVTLMAVCWFTYSFYNVFIKRNNIISNTFYMIFFAWLIIIIKPYIFIALVPGSLIWFSFDRIRVITNPIVKFLITPVIFAAIGIIGYFGLSSLSSSFGDYSSLDKIVDKAIVTQQDLKKDYYEGNSFDIGEFDGSFGSIIRKAPIATFAGLFYPQLWQSRNIVMLVAAVENTIILIVFIVFLFRVGFKEAYKQVRGQPLLIFSLVFAISFAFSVGLSTSNFGALVRYKIPAVPFFFSAILILYQNNKKKVPLKAN